MSRPHARTTICRNPLRVASSQEIVEEPCPKRDSVSDRLPVAGRGFVFERRACRQRPVDLDPHGVDERLRVRIADQGLRTARYQRPDRRYCDCRGSDARRDIPAVVFTVRRGRHARFVAPSHRLRRAHRDSCNQISVPQKVYRSAIAVNVVRRCRGCCYDEFGTVDNAVCRRRIVGAVDRTVSGMTTWTRAEIGALGERSGGRAPDIAGAARDCPQLALPIRRVGHHRGRRRNAHGGFRRGEDTHQRPLRRGGAGGDPGEGPPVAPAWRGCGWRARTAAGRQCASTSSACGSAGSGVRRSPTCRRSADDAGTAVGDAVLPGFTVCGPMLGRRGVRRRGCRDHQCGGEATQSAS